MFAGLQRCARSERCDTVPFKLALHEHCKLGVLIRIAYEDVRHRPPFFFAAFRRNPVEISYAATVARFWMAVATSLGFAPSAKRALSNKSIETVASAASIFATRD